MNQEKPTKVVGRRVAAFLIDIVILTAFNLLVFLPFADKRSDIEAGLAPGEQQAIFVNLNLGGDEYSIEGSGKALAYIAIVWLAAFLYFGVLQGLKGWTPGKLALGIRVVDEQGHAGPGVGKATVRWLLWIVDSFPWLIPYVVGFVCALATNTNRRVGDMVAKTLVVRSDAVGRPPFGQPALQGAAGAGWHPDPHGQARLRYWDGSSWTEHTSP